MTLQIPDAVDNAIPYEVYHTLMGQRKTLKAKRLTSALRLCTGTLETVADKLRYARLSAGLHQDVLADRIGIDRITLLRYENGHIAEDSMRTDWLIRIAVACGMEKYFCCSPYHIFVAEDAGKKIAEYRKKMGLTQKGLSEKLDVSQATVNRWEKNENKPPRSVWELVNSLDISSYM